MKAKTSSLLALYFVVFMDNFGFAMLFGLLGPLLLLPEYGIIPSTTSFAVKNGLLAIAYGAFPLMQFFGAPIIGDIADHYGRKRALYITILGVTIGYLFSVFSIVLHSITLIIISRLFTGFFAGNLSISLAAMADLSHDNTVRAKRFSNVTAVYGLSWIIAMVVGGYISDPDFIHAGGPVLGFIITAALSLINFIAVWIYFYETAPEKGKYKMTLFKGVKNILHVVDLKSVRFLFVAYLFWVIGWGMSIQWFPPYSIEEFRVSVADITTWMMFIGIGWIVGSSLINRILLKKLSSLAIGSISLVLVAILMAFAGAMKHYSLFASSYLIAALFSALIMSNMIHIISTNAPIDVQGKTMGLSQSMMALGWIVSAIIALSLNRHDIGFVYYLSAILLLIPIGIVGAKLIRSLHG